MTAIETETVSTHARSENRVSSVLRQPVVQPIFSAASKSPEFADRLRSHYRETRRIAVEIPCSIELVLLDGDIYDSGSAVIRNISPSGALLTTLCMSLGGYPSSPFKIRMVLNGDPYSGIGIEATPVRFALGQSGLGVKFDEIFVAV